MCGIASIMRLNNDSVETADLARMCSAIAHRGPDGAAYAILDRGRVGLGHVRLSIVDLNGGEQPLYNEDYSISAVCNGELYDYEQLRRSLTNRGHNFRTASDSELLVHLYEEHGTDLFQHLHGEFAFLLWDARQRRLIAGRDPCGVKPLYYTVTADEIVLASEIKVIYALEPSSDPSTPVSFARLTAAESLPLLLAQAHAFSVNEPEHNQRLMRDYVSLAVAVSCFRFTFPRTFSALDSNLDQLEAHAANSGVNGALTERERRGVTTASGPAL